MFSSVDFRLINLPYKHVAPATKRQPGVTSIHPRSQPPLSALRVKALRQVICLPKLSASTARVSQPESSKCLSPQSDDPQTKVESEVKW